MSWAGREHPRRRRRVPIAQSLTIAALSVAASGCYTYAPKALPEIPVATEVRMHLAEAARERLGPALRPDQRHLDGLLVERGHRSVLLEIPIRSTGSAGIPAPQRVQRVSLGADEIAAVEVKELSTFRTSLAATVVVTAAAAILVRVFYGEAGGGKYPPIGGPGPNETVVPNLYRR